jgi:WD40 repeat protein
MLTFAAAVEPTEKRRHRIKHGETFLSRKLGQTNHSGADHSGAALVIEVKDKKKVMDTSDVTNFSTDLDCALYQEYPSRGSVKACAASAEAQMVAFGGTSCNVTVCSLFDGKQKWKFEHKGDIRGCQFSGDGKLLATCGEDKYVRIWSTENGNMKYECKYEQNCLTVAWSHDGTMLATGGDGNGKKIRVWSHDKPETLIFEEEEELPQPVNVVRFSGDGKWFGIAGGNSNSGGYVYIYKLNKR